MYCPQKIWKGVLFLSLVLGACSDSRDAGTQRTETAVEHAQKHLDPKYVCPMHPQIVRDAPGNCPVCGMALVQRKPEATSAREEQTVLYYRHPHNPSIISDTPKKDEMGMDYVPVYATGGRNNIVRIDPQIVQNLGVRTAKAFSDQLVRRIEMAGIVEVNENNVHHIHLRTQGWVEKLYVSSDGERVRKGQLLFEVYSPELVNAQLEYLQAVNVGNPRLLPVSRERLQALGLSEKQIDRLAERKKVDHYLQVYSPQEGIVEKLNIRHGMYVTPDRETMSIANLDDIWIVADVLERQTAWIKRGQSAEVQLNFLPRQRLKGTVDYVYPHLNAKTRTLRVRLHFKNPDELLKPNMYAQVSVEAVQKGKAIQVPREAVIHTANSARVLLALGNGRFMSREVRTGLETEQYIEILEGLDQGDEVVVSGQFFIDSEASLKASLQRIADPSNTDQGEK